MLYSTGGVGPGHCTVRGAGLGCCTNGGVGQGAIQWDGARALYSVGGRAAGGGGRVL